MATYKVQAPDGTEITVEGPAGASQEEVIAQAKRLYEERRQRLLAMPYSEITAGNTLIPEQPQPVQLGPVGRAVRGVVKGAMIDPAEAITQLVGGEEGRKAVAEREAAYQASRAAAGDTGIEFSRIAGNILSPAGLIAPVKAAQLAAPLGRAAQGVAAGAAGAVTMPTTGGATDLAGFAQEKAEQAGFGAVFGLGGYYLGKAITPQVKQGVDDLLAQGIPVTPGQAYTGVPGWFFRQIESFDLPTMRVEREAINSQFTKSIGNEVLSSIGGKVDPDATTGIQIFTSVHNQIKKTYDDAIKNIPPTPADNLVAGVSEGLDIAKAQLSTAKKAKALENDIRANVFNKIKDGQINGEDLKTIESYLRKKSSSIKAFDSDADALRSGYDEILKTVKSFIGEVDTSGNIAKANEAWMKRARLKDAVTKSVAEAPGASGVVSPKQMLQEAARQGEGAQAALGTAPLQRQATQAFDIVGDTTSGEASKYRNMLILGKFTGIGIYGLFQPAIAIPILVASGMSYGTAQKLLTSPNLRNALNQAIEKIGPSEASKLVESIRMQSNAQEQ
jgi:hypothetical protein